MSLRTSTLATVFAASLLAPAAASATAAQLFPLAATEGTTVGVKGSARPSKGTAFVILSTPSGGYFHVPATKDRPASTSMSAPARSPATAPRP